jgi:hypothetical protein
LKSEKLVFKIIINSLENESVVQHSDFTDDEFVKMLSTRGDKRFNAPEKLHPMAGGAKFKTILKELEEVRNNSISFVQSTNAQLRQHFSKSPIGNLDTYQWTLQISAHMLRHIEQIEEILASENFPKP